MEQQYIDRFHSKYIKQPNGCWEWQAYKDKFGHGYYYTGKQTLYMGAHRFSYLIHKGDPADMCVCHTCDNPACVNPDHLWLGTKGDNTRDRHSKGRTTRGEQQHSSKLTASDVLAIRASTERVPVLAERYGVSHTRIYMIRARKAWKHI